MNNTRYNLHTLDDIRSTVEMITGGELVYQRLVFNVMIGQVELTIRKFQHLDDNFCKKNGITDAVVYILGRLYYGKIDDESKWNNIIDQYIPVDYVKERIYLSSTISLPDFVYYEGHLFNNNSYDALSKNHYCWLNSIKLLTEPYNEHYNYQQDHESYNPANDELASARVEFNNHFNGKWGALRSYNTEERILSPIKKNKLVPSLNNLFFSKISPYSVLYKVYKKNMSLKKRILFHTYIGLAYLVYFLFIPFIFCDSLITRKRF